MNRLLSPLLALAILVGLGYVTRNYYWPWFQDKLKESQEHSRKEMEKMINARPKWADVKFDSSKLINPGAVKIPTIPKGSITPPRPNRPPDNPIRQK